MLAGLRRLLGNNRWLLLAAGFVAGAALVLAIRFATYQSPHVHYHANFAVYINGQREQFKNPQYYQEVNVCALNGATPEGRVHMHEPDNSVIHVHDSAVTWGQFFENLGWIIGPDFIRSTTTMYRQDGTTKLNLVLNGQDLTGLTDITDQVIHDKDRLLVSYGPSDAAVLSRQYAAVPATAAKFDNSTDPASCGGNESNSLSERLHHLF